MPQKCTSHERIVNNEVQFGAIAKFYVTLQFCLLTFFLFSKISVHV